MLPKLSYLSSGQITFFDHHNANLKANNNTTTKPTNTTSTNHHYHNLNNDQNHHQHNKNDGNLNSRADVVIDQDLNDNEEIKESKLFINKLINSNNNNNCNKRKILTSCNNNSNSSNSNNNNNIIITDKNDHQNKDKEVDTTNSCLIVENSNNSTNCNDSNSNNSKSKSQDDEIQSFYFNLTDLEELNKTITTTATTSCYCSSSSSSSSTSSSSTSGCIGCTNKKTNRSLSILDKYSSKQREFNAARNYHQLEKLLLLSLSSSSLISSSTSSCTTQSSLSPTQSKSDSKSSSPPLSSSTVDSNSSSSVSSLVLAPESIISQDTKTAEEKEPELAAIAAVAAKTVEAAVAAASTESVDTSSVVFVSKKSISLENSATKQLRKQFSLVNLATSTNNGGEEASNSSSSNICKSSSSSSNRKISITPPKNSSITNEKQKEAKEIANSNCISSSSNNNNINNNISTNKNNVDDNIIIASQKTPQNIISNFAAAAAVAAAAAPENNSNRNSATIVVVDTLEPIVRIVKDLETNIKQTLMHQTKQQVVTTSDSDYKSSNKIEDYGSRHEKSKPPHEKNSTKKQNSTINRKCKSYNVSGGGGGGSSDVFDLKNSSVEQQIDKTKIITFNAALIQQKSLLKKNANNYNLTLNRHGNSNHTEDPPNHPLSIFEIDDISLVNSKLNNSSSTGSNVSSSDEQSLSVTSNSENVVKCVNLDELKIQTAANSMSSSDNSCSSNSSSSTSQLIVSRHGTVRGSLNHVKTSLKQIFKEPQITSPVANPQLNITPSNNYYNYNCATINTKVNEKLISHYYLARNYEEEEDQKIIIYTTSLQIVRLSYDKCKRVKKILQNHCVRYEERDLYKNKEYQRELKYRLNINQVDVPHIFFNGKHVGNCDQLELYSDQGVLNNLFKDLEKIKLRIYCSKCGGYRFVLCTLCNGSKKKFNNFTNLKCTTCNEDGLIRCNACLDQQE